jgi:hypothetical protein
MTYKETAKKLGIKWHIGKYGFKFGYKPYPDGMKGKWRPIWIEPLDGWIFDPHEIVQALADDPAFSISYDKKGFSDSLSPTKKRVSKDTKSIKREGE